MKVYYLLLLLPMLVFIACGDSEIEEQDDSVLGYDYFPLEVGDTWIYSVDSLKIVQEGLSNRVTQSFIREQVTDLINEDDDERSYRIERSYRSDSIGAWQLTDVWTTSIDDDRATRTEENLRFIKLVFPVVEGTSWDGNAFFDDSKFYPAGADEIQIYLDWNYRLVDQGNSAIIGSINYEDVAKVEQHNDTTNISLRYAEETYAKGIGLVERRMAIYDTQEQNTDLSWDDRAEVGFRLHQTLISYTKG